MSKSDLGSKLVLGRKGWKASPITCDVTLWFCVAGIGQAPPPANQNSGLASKPGGQAPHPTTQLSSKAHTSFALHEPLVLYSWGGWLASLLYPRRKT